MTKFGLVQTLWDPIDDVKFFKFAKRNNLVFADLVPSKYCDRLSKSYDWESLRRRFEDAGVEVRSIQGFLFGGDYSLCPQSRTWEETLARFDLAGSVAERLNARNLILGAPSARACESHSTSSCCADGLELIISTWPSSGPEILLENLPNGFQSSYASDFSVLFDAGTPEVMSRTCFDIGNHFSWFESYSAALPSIEKILIGDKVRHVQANLISAKIAQWIVTLLRTHQLEIESVSIEGRLGSLERLEKFIRELPN